MKMTNENKIKILESIFAIEQICKGIKNEIFSGDCFDSGKFMEIEFLYHEAEKLNKLNQ